MSKNSILVATPQLRFLRYRAFIKPDLVGFKEVLQQYWTDPLGASGVGEWRNVPLIDLDSQSTPNFIFPDSPVVNCGD